MPSAAAISASLSLHKGDASAVGPSSHGDAKTRWSFAASVSKPSAAARRA